ncbi:heme exporter protein CcmB [bacterium]|nr:heme exporter protein CcmB [bacterium]
MLVHFLKKEFTLLLKTPEKFFSVFLFSFLIVLLFSLSFHDVSRASVVGLYWIYILFAGVLRFNQSFDDENEGNAWDLLKINSTGLGLFGAKVIFNFVILLLLSLFFFVVEQAIFPVYFLRSEILLFLKVIPLALISFAVIGTLFSGFITGGTFKELLFTLLFYPLSLPLILVCFFVVGEGSTGMLVLHLEWYRFLVGVALIYCIASTMMFDYYYQES